jgi:molybdate transport system regulatory protein
VVNVTLQIRSKHWVVDGEGRIIMGEGRLALLELIEQTGSISQAAKQAKISYKAAWSKIRSTETHLGRKVVNTEKGRGSSLTPEGQDILAKYREMKRLCIQADDRAFNKIFK